MKLIEQSLQEVLDQVESKQPAPGGGSVSALAGALGVSLARMVGHLTTGKKAYAQHDQKQREAFEHALEELHEFRYHLIRLIDEDTIAFNQIMKAYKLPKETEEQQNKRTTAIEEATKQAIRVPYEVAQLSLRALKTLDVIEQLGNKNALSDVGVAALQLGAAVEGALLNVLINLPGLSDETARDMYHRQADLIRETARELTRKRVASITDKLK